MIRELIVAISLALAGACAAAQDDASIPVIRVEADEVLIPVFVGAKGPRGDYIVGHLDARDFRLLEDGTEQKITSAARVLVYDVAYSDNEGYQTRDARTRKGAWANLLISAPSSTVLAPLYVVAYRPPPSPEGSCHKITIKVSPKDESGRRYTSAELGPLQIGNTVQTLTWEADRSDLILKYRRQYCNIAHPAADPLYGTPESKKLEEAATNDKAEMRGFYLSAFDLFGEGNTPRIYVALDFPHLSSQSGIPAFQAALLGVFHRADGSLAARFSDSSIEGCPFPEDESDSGMQGFCGQQGIDNHYETDAELPPGDYDLRVAVDFGGALRRAEVPVHVSAPENRLAVSGIALCKRYFAPGHPLQAEPPNPEGIPTLPFELNPLVSKGIEFTPTAMTQFKTKDPLAAYFEVYEPLLAADGAVHVQFEIRVVDAKTGDVKVDTGFRAADAFVNLDRAVIPISEQLAIGELGPGEYRLQIRAMDSAGSTTDWRSTTFTRE